MLGKRESSKGMAEQMKVYTVKDVARILQVEPHFVYRLVRAGALQSQRLGKRVIRITEKALMSYVNAQREEVRP